MPHSSLILGFGTLGLGLGGSGASSLRHLSVSLRNVNPKDILHWSAGREHPVLLPMRGASSPRPRLRRSETSEHSLPVLRLGVRVIKTGGFAAGTGVEIAEGAKTGGGVKGE